MANELATQLSRKQCRPCGAHDAALPRAEIDRLLAAVPQWKLEGKAISRQWLAKDFLTAIDYFQRIAPIAEAEDHHPDLNLVEYRKITVTLWTHAVNGLTENDFIMAAKIDQLPLELKPGT